MRHLSLGQYAAALLGALGAFVLIVPASSGEAVRLSLVHEQTLESEQGSDGPVSLINLCGRIGFLFGRDDEDGHDRWYLYRISDGTLSDAGMTYPEAWPLGCSADGRWVLSTPFFGSGTASLHSLVNPDTGPLLSVARGMPIWSDYANATFIVFVMSGDRDASIVQNDSSDDVEVFAAQIKPDSFAGWPIWTPSGNLLVALSDGVKNQIVELSVDSFQFHSNTQINPLLSIEKGAETEQSVSLLHTAVLDDPEKIDIQSVGDLVLIQEFGNPSVAVRHLCEREVEWQCKPVLATPENAIAGFENPQITLLDASGRLFWIEDRDGEFCIVSAFAGSQDNDCEPNVPLELFEEIFHYQLDPVQRYLYVIGRRPYEHHSYLAVFELDIVPAE